MNGEYLFKVFQYCGEKDLPDLTIALAMMQPEYPMPEGMTYGKTCSFIGWHYWDLVKAYDGGKDLKKFVEAVEKAVADDIAREEERKVVESR